MRVSDHMRYISYSSSNGSGPLQKVAAVVGTVAVAAALLVFSSVFLAVLAVVAVVGGAVVWWKTRHVRKIMREMRASMKRARGEFEGGDWQGPWGAQGPFGQAAQSGQSGQYAREERYEGVIIEGEAVRVDERDARTRR